MGSSALSARKTTRITDLHLLVVLLASVLFNSAIVARFTRFLRSASHRVGSKDRSKHATITRDDVIPPSKNLQDPLRSYIESKNTRFYLRVVVDTGKGRVLAGSRGP
jgi:hypothetical protein